MGAPKENRNRLRHGLHASGGLPPECRNVAKSVGAYRRALENTLLAERGGIGPVEAGLIASAARWERYSLLAARWLREHYAELTPDQRLKFAGETARAATNRDAAVGKLKLDISSDPCDVVARSLAEGDAQARGLDHDAGGYGSDGRGAHELEEDSGE